MLRPFRKEPGRLEAAERVKHWTRERFGLERDATVLVAELECGLAGCPPLETVVSFWEADGARYQFKIFKALQEVSIDDLPFAWMKDALDARAALDCVCC